MDAEPARAGLAGCVGGGQWRDPPGDGAVSCQCVAAGRDRFRSGRRPPTRHCGATALATDRTDPPPGLLATVAFIGAWVVSRIWAPDRRRGRPRPRCLLRRRHLRAARGCLRRRRLRTAGPPGAGRRAAQPEPGCAGGPADSDRGRDHCCGHVAECRRARTRGARSRGRAAEGHDHDGGSADGHSEGEAHDHGAGRGRLPLPRRRRPGVVRRPERRGARGAPHGADRGPGAPGTTASWSVSSPSPWSR